MPLSPSVKRQPVHRRRIEAQSYEREDGLWDIEGHLTDIKAYAFHSDFRGEIAPGTPIHDMWVRLTVDSDNVVQDVEAVTDAGPYALCPAITPSFSKLVGVKIGPGWKGKVRELLGGVAGCTHMVDLLGPMATVAYHTVHWSRSNATGSGDAVDQTAQRPPLNACHVWASDGDLVRRKFPAFYTGPDHEPE